jgi:hypothetical protein
MEVLYETTDKAADVTRASKESNSEVYNVLNVIIIQKANTKSECRAARTPEKKRGFRKRYHEGVNILY